MKIHCLKHVPFEGPGLLETWLEQRGLQLTTHLVPESGLPDVWECEALIVMGGPMNIYQHRDHPWLVGEKAFLRECLDRGVPILGICLGAQLLADVLGARVFQNPEKEIGWFPIDVTPDFLAEFPEFPSRIDALHWHGDTFELPEGSLRVAASSACQEQGFYVPDRCLGLQFHVESTQDSLEALLQNCGDELSPDRFVQSANEIRTGCNVENFTTWEPVFESLLGLEKSSVGY